MGSISSLTVKIRFSSKYLHATLWANAFSLLGYFSRIFFLALDIIAPARGCREYMLPFNLCTFPDYVILQVEFHFS